jgi:hypothetical protein
VRGGGQAGAGLQLLQGQREKDGGGGAAGVGQRAGSEQPLPGIQQRIMPPLPSTAPIPLPGINVGDWAGEGVQDGLPHRRRLRGQLREQPARPVRQRGQDGAPPPLVVALGGEDPVRVQAGPHRPGQHRQLIRIQHPGVLNQHRLDGLGLVKCVLR